MGPAAGDATWYYAPNYDAVEMDEYVVGNGVLLGLVPAGEDPETAELTKAVAAKADGTFATTLPIAGLDPGDYSVVVKACAARSCDLRTVDVTI